MDAYIQAISYYVPKQTLSTSELVSIFPEWTVEKVCDKIGVDQRHIASENETASDMAIQAANLLFNEHPEIDKENIDYIIFCTQCPDYIMPSSACLIQQRLGLSTSCGAFDYNLGCSGYIYGLSIAKGLIVAGIAKQILLLTADTLSKYLHPRDKCNRSLFGDAASATIISRVGFARIGDFSLGTDGAGAENIIVRTGATRHTKKLDDTYFDENGNPHSSDYLYINGHNVFSFVQTHIPNIVFDTVAKNNLSINDVDFFVFHQASSLLLNFLRKKLKIPEEKFYLNLQDVGNTSSNSIPIALSESKNNGRLVGNTLLCGFGVGYSWGSCMLKIQSTFE